MEIVVKNLKKAFKGHVILNDISFSVKPGEVLGILGSDGSGKTTIMQLLTAYLTPDDGEICYNGTPLSKNSEKIKRNIGYLSENNPLYESMTIADFLSFMAHLCKVPKYIMPTRIMDVLRVCHLDHERYMPIKHLSKGTKRRVGIAQAIINSPTVLLLDEPTSGLDPNQSEGIRNLIKEIAKERTVIIGSHLLSDIKETCDRILIVNKGFVVADGTTLELQNKESSDKCVKVKLAPVSLQKSARAIQQLPNVERVEIKDEYLMVHCKRNSKIEQNIFNLCIQESWYIKNLTVVELSLDDIFRSLTLN